MLKKLSLLFLLFLMILPLFSSIAVSASENETEKIEVYFFEDRLCPVCKEQKAFMLELQDKYPQMDLKIYPISDIEKLREVAQKHGVEDYNVMAPTTFIGENFFQFQDFTPRHEDMLIRALEGEVILEDCCTIKIPFLNVEVDISKWSLPVITLVLGSLDGLNVCSLGALILILSIVMKFNSRKKTFLYGGLFIVSATVIYGILIFTWGKIFEGLIGQLEILRIIVGLAALTGAVFFSRDFFKFLKYGPACENKDSKLKTGATNRIIRAFNDPKTGTIFMITSIIFFAGAVTLVELPCSIGLPIAFTGILAEKSLSLTSYIFYVVFYLFFFMLIELIVFTGAVLTKRLWFAGSKLITFVTLLGALVLYYLAFYYLFS